MLDLDQGTLLQYILSWFLFNEIISKFQYVPARYLKTIRHDIFQRGLIIKRSVVLERAKLVQYGTCTAQFKPKHLYYCLGRVRTVSLLRQTGLHQGGIS